MRKSNKKARLCTLYPYILSFIIVGGIYITIEILFRKIIGSTPTHYTMFILSGTSGAFCWYLSQIHTTTWQYWILKPIANGLFITLGEIIIGFSRLYIFHLPRIWHYGTLDILGIVSLTWSLLWCVLSVPIILCMERVYRYYIYKKQNKHIGGK